MLYKTKERNINQTKLRILMGLKESVRLGILHKKRMQKNFDSRTAPLGGA